MFSQQTDNTLQLFDLARRLDQFIYGAQCHEFGNYR